MITSREGPILVPGIRLTISLPFSGDAKLWHLSPNLWSSVLPRGIVKEGFDGIGYLQNNLDNILRIPLRHDPSAPNIQSIKIQKRIVKPLPQPPIGGHKTEWGIEEKDYEDILAIVRHEGRTFEALPKTFAIHDEKQSCICR